MKHGIKRDWGSVRDYTAEVRRAGSEIIRLVDSYIATYSQGGVAAEEASRFLNRAKEMHSLGLYAFALIDALHAYLLASMEADLGPLQDPREPWRIGLQEVVDAKASAVDAQSRYNPNGVRGTIKGLLLYRFHSYIKSGDNLVSLLVERVQANPGLLDGLEDSVLLKEAYIAYAEAAYSLNNLDKVYQLLAEYNRS